MPADAPLLVVRDLRVRLGGQEIVQSADLQLRPGTLVAVVGPNGAGKSTIVRAAAGLLKPAGGSIEWGGTEIRRVGPKRLARLRAFVPQRPEVPQGITVREAALIGRSSQIGVLSRPGAADRAAAMASLERADAAEFADRQLSTLSGGELQRVQLAVGLAQGAPALIADEPTSALDLGATATIARLLRRLADEGLGIILVVHDLALASAIADEVVVVAGGRTVAAGPADRVLTADRLHDTWRVDAALRTDHAGRTALHVGWLTPRDAPAGDGGPAPETGDDAAAVLAAPGQPAPVVAVPNPGTVPGPPGGIGPPPSVEPAGTASPSPPSRPDPDREP